ncbi:hypothetical protein PENSPDRAFT_753052 [Peniophora sp. CONT]|nr:hypothetical protein PENSPDRAFT_753052 [Peniophora sp. CONT]
MIQKVNAPRAGKTAIAPFIPPAADNTDSDGLPDWGSWRDGKHWKIEIVQQPIRARMCGFGDKDRRPIAPAVVAKLIVQDEDNKLLEETDIDYAFLVVTVDLWSPDGKSERNLVIHPGSSERHAAAHASNKKRRTTAPEKHESSLQPSPASAPGTFGPLSIPTLPVLPSLSLQSPYDQQQASAWPSSYSMPPPQDTVPLHRPRTLSLDHPPSDDEWGHEESEVGPYRTWSADPSYAPLAPLAPAPGPSRRNSPPPSIGYSPPRPPTLPQLPARIELQEAPPPSPPTPASAMGQPPTPSEPPSEAGIGAHRPPYDESMYAPASVAQGFPLATAASQGVSGKGKARRAMPGDAYTRTLVGPVAASASRLLDEHRKPGVFFLFQDLSIRTEGAFRLRLRLMNLGPPIPPPEDEMPSINTGFSAVLSEVYSQPFDVHTAKRFPGVPDTTALSIAFGNQGQKLPLRSRHGSRKGRRRRGEESSDDDDED